MIETTALLQRLHRHVRRLTLRARAATGVEYAILLGLVGAAVLGALAATGGNLSRVVCNAGAQLQQAAGDRDADCLSWSLDFALADRDNVPPASPVDSGAIAPTGMSEPLHIALADGGTGAQLAVVPQSAGTDRIAAGESFRVTFTAPDAELAPRLLSVTVGSLTRDWHVTTGCRAGRVVDPADAGQCTEASRTENCELDGVTGQHSTVDGGASWSACTVPAFTVADLTGWTPGAPADTGSIAPSGVLWTRTLAASGSGNPVVSVAGQSGATRIDPGQSFSVAITTPALELTPTVTDIDLGGAHRLWTVTTGCLNAGRIADPFGSASCVAREQERDCSGGNGDPGRQQSHDGGAHWDACAVPGWSFADRSGVVPGSSQASGDIVPTGLLSARPISVAGGGSPSLTVNGSAAGGQIAPGQPFALSLTAAAAELQTTTASVTVAGVTRSWHVATGCFEGRVVDPNDAAHCAPIEQARDCTAGGSPGKQVSHDAGASWSACSVVDFAIAASTDVTAGAPLTTAQIVPTGVIAPVAASIGGGTSPSFSFSGGAASGTLQPGTNFTVSLTASTAEYSSYSVPVTVGGIVRNWAISTLCRAGRIEDPLHPGSHACVAQVQTRACSGNSVQQTQSTYDGGVTWSPCTQVTVGAQGQVSFGSVTVYFSNVSGYATTTASVQTGDGPVTVKVQLSNSAAPFRNDTLFMTVNSDSTFTVAPAPGYYAFMCADHARAMCAGVSNGATLEANCYSPVRYTTSKADNDSKSANRLFVQKGSADSDGRACTMPSP